jgi:hypothetical protein
MSLLDKRFVLDKVMRQEVSTGWVHVHKYARWADEKGG